MKYSVPFIKCLGGRNNTQVDDAHDNILWQYCRNELTVNVFNGVVYDCDAINASTNLFKITEKITGKAGNNGTKSVEIIVPLKCLSNFLKNLETPFTKYETNLDLNWSLKCVIVDTAVADQGATFLIIDTKLVVPVVTLSTQNNVKLKSGFKRTINWNKYQSKVSTERSNQYLGYLIDPICQGENRFFVLSFQENAHRTSYKRYFFSDCRNKILKCYD